jgi:ammonium transporter, Amt family
MNSGDTAWVLAASALVLLMTPGLAFFYGGMTRVKSTLNMMMMSFITIGIVSILWIFFGYSLAFGHGTSGLYGSFKWNELTNAANQLVTANGSLYGIPVLVFAAFQLMFAIITPALISGAIADRTKFLAWGLFVIIWSTLVYFPVAHWVFDFGTVKGVGAGWLAKLGVEDFAGGTAVHINAGAAGLALCLVLGRRVGWKKDPMRPHNLPLVLIGAGLLWFGWFGFNAGSALGANGQAAIAFMNTQVATAAAVVGWLIVEKVRDKHATSLGAASGAVAGLVAITPACAFLTPGTSILLGILAGALCAYAVGLKYKLGFDDSLDVVGVHMVGGIFGCLFIGIFGVVWNVGGATWGAAGLWHGGGFSLLGKQAIGAFSVLAYSFIVAYIVGWVINKTIGFRVDKDVELQGVDLVEHGETAYDYTSVGGSFAGVGAAAAAQYEEDNK